VPITAEDLTGPPYWLVYGLPWPEDAAPGAMAEAAFAFAPLVTGPLRRAAKDVVYVADVYHSQVGGRVVFFSDLTRFLAQEHTSWQERRTEWELAFRQLDEGEGGATPVPCRYIQVSRRGHAILCDASVDGLTFFHSDGTRERVTEQERAAVRDAFADALARDWPPYIQDMIGRGLLTLA
jgi:hypothetical protein